MKLYKITATNQDTSTDSKIVWVGSQADAVQARKTFAAEGFSRKEVDTVEVNIPTDKTGLLAYLNGG